MQPIFLNLESLFEEHKSLIGSVIRRNRPLLSALRVDDEDAAQQLSIAMLSAIRKFNPDRSASLAAHIKCSLQYEILNIKRRHKPHGITGVPEGYRPDFIYLDSTIDGGAYGASFDDDITIVEFSELFENLTESEAEAVNLKIQGYPIRRKAHISSLDGVHRRYEEL